MSFGVRMEFTGLGEVLAQLKGVEAKIRKKALKKIVNDASKALLWSARSGVPRRKPKGVPRHWDYKGSQLKRSLGRKVKVYKGTVVGVVGAREGFRIQVGVLTRNGPAGSKKRGQKGDPIFVNPIKYLHLVLLGTSHSRADNFLAKAQAGLSARLRAEAAATVEEVLKSAGRG